MPRPYLRPHQEDRAVRKRAIDAMRIATVAYLADVRLGVDDRNLAVQPCDGTEGVQGGQTGQRVYSEVCNWLSSIGTVI